MTIDGDKQLEAIFELIDADNDGITTDLDLCPNTDIGVTVNANGCAENQLDNDGDGIFNDADQCAGTSDGAIVDENGCASNLLGYPNILLIITDDLGNDMLAGFNDYEIIPITPTLDSLRSVGVSCTNVWSSPICSPTRAGLITGQYGFRTDVLNAGDLLDETTPSIQQRINEDFPDQYAHGVIGKWQLSGQPTIRDHPYSFGFDYFAAVIGGSVSSYTDYQIIIDQAVSRESTYATQKFTNLAADWIEAQSQSWFLWMTYIAPHTPYEVPLDDTYTQADISDNYGKYLASMESLDHYINQLIVGMEDDVKANTLFIFVGDNGTDNELLRGYSEDHGKGTVYEGGVRVPLIIAGPGVGRAGAFDNSMIQSLDLPALILNYMGGAGSFGDGKSFFPLLNTTGSHREYLYTESVNTNNSVYAVKNASYKLWIKNEREALCYHGENLREDENLLNTDLTDEAQTRYDALKNYVSVLKDE